MFAFMKRMAEKMFIYALINPINDKVFYIGQSKNILVRIMSHLNRCYERKTPKDNILINICEAGLFPKYQILEEIEVDLTNKISIFNVAERERFWINDSLQKGNGIANLQLYNDAIELIEDDTGRRINCRYCGKVIKAKTTKRMFCNDKCRIYFGREEGRKKGVVNAFLEQPLVTKAHAAFEHSYELPDDIQKQIKELEAETPPPERSTTLGKKVWFMEQANKIAELKNKL